MVSTATRVAPGAPGEANTRLREPRVWALMAADLDDGVGNEDGSFNWRLPSDLARFRRLTQGCVCIVGRRTAEVLPELPGRTLVMLTSDKHAVTRCNAVLPARSPSAAVRLAHKIAKGRPAWVIGGPGALWAMLPFIQTALITRVLGATASSVKIPPWLLRQLSPLPLKAGPVTRGAGDSHSTQLELWGSPLGWEDFQAEYGALR